MQASDPSPATLAVLAGGASSRMGTAKAELRVNGKPMLRYLLDHWNWPGETMLVTAPGQEHPEGCDAFDREVIDAVSDQGPLRGLVTALQNASPGRVVIATTCDMPLVTRAMLDHFVAMIQQDEAALALMSRRGGDIEPFPFATRVRALPALLEQLQAGKRSLHRLASLPHFRVIDAPSNWPASVWTNLNSPADYEAFVASLQW